MHKLLISTVVALTTLVLGSAAVDAAPDLRLLRSAHNQRCGSDAPCKQCFWPVKGDYKYIAMCDEGDASVGAECRCKSQAGWQKGIVLMSYPDQIIGR